MEAVARQFATDKKCLVIRNGWFSYRWSQRFDMGRIPAESVVLKGASGGSRPQAPLPPPGRGSGRRHPRAEARRGLRSHVETAPA